MQPQGRIAHQRNMHLVGALRRRQVKAVGLIVLAEQNSVTDIFTEGHVMVVRMGWPGIGTG